MLPKLEGTAHVNMVLVIKFMQAYLFEKADLAEVKQNYGPSEDGFLFRQGATTKGLEKVIPGNMEKTYSLFDTPNLRIFKKQIELLKEFLQTTPPDKDQSKDLDFMLPLGEIFTLIAYGGLILEQAKLEQTSQDLLDEIFAVQVRDFSRYATVLHGKYSTTEAQGRRLLEMLQKAVYDSGRFDRVCAMAYALKDKYRMSETGSNG